MSKDNNQRRPPDDPFEMLFQGFSELVENLSQLGDTAPEEWEKSFRNQANRTDFTYNSNGMLDYYDGFEKVEPNINVDLIKLKQEWNWYIGNY